MQRNGLRRPDDDEADDLVTAFAEGNEAAIAAWVKLASFGLVKDPSAAAAAVEAYAEAWIRWEKADVVARGLADIYKNQLAALRAAIDDLRDRCGDDSAEALMEGLPSLAELEQRLAPGDRPQVFGGPGDTGPVDPVM